MKIIILIAILCCGVYMYYQANTEQVPVLPASTTPVSKYILDVNYMRSLLHNKDQQVYDQIYEALLKQTSEIQIDQQTTEDIVSIYQSVLKDHPQIFWVNGLQYREVKKYGTFQYFILYPTYIMTQEEVEQKNMQLEQLTDTILEPVRLSTSTYEKVKYVYDYIIDHCEYIVGSKHNQNILSVLEYGQSVCAGYAKTAQYLLQKLGIRCAYITGKSLKQGVEHAWNLIEIDGSYVYMDTTWGDPLSNQLYNKTYAYFMMTLEEVLSLYAPNEKLPTPLKEEISYYRKENAYFTQYDEEQILTLMKKAINEQQPFIELKCQDEATRLAIQTILFDEQKVGVLLRKCGVSLSSIFYYINEELQMIKIML